MSSNKASSLKSLKCVYFNAHSIRNKAVDLNAFLTLHKSNFDLIFVSETWLKPTDTFVQNGYSILRTDRQHSKGGGCLMMIRNSINANYNVVAAIQEENVEALVVDISTKHDKIRFLVLYSPPKCNNTQKDALCKIMNEYSDINYPIVIAGDLNCPNIDWVNDTVDDNHPTELEICYELLSLGFKQYVFEPTHIAGNILDVILCNDAYRIFNLEVIGQISPSCDHYTVTFECQLSESEVEAEKKKLNFRKAHYGYIKQFLLDLDWNIVLDKENAEDCYAEFLDALNFVINELVPISKPSKRNMYSEQTKKAFKQKQKAFKHWKRTGTGKAEYESCRKNAQRLARSDTYAMEQRVLNSHDPKRFYSYVKSKSKAQEIIPAIKKDGNLILDKQEKTKLLNEYFSTVYTRDDGSLPNLSNTINTSMGEIMFTEENVLKALKSVPSSVSVGPDQIPNLFLKKCCHELAKPLCIIFRKIFETGQIPKIWKLAHIVPIYKNKGDRSDCSNYRPISLTSTISKVMERVVRSQLYQYLVRNNILSKEQHGFRTGFSTTTQLLEYMDDITRSMDTHTKTQIDAVYLDYAKAFDTVSHPKLIHKLKSIGISGRLLSFIENFLSERKQCVKLENQLSTEISVISGVPQGTVLGPILFTIYINDIVKTLKSTKIKMYADDCKLYREVKNSQDHKEFLEDLESVASWANMWQLSLSVPKCQVISIGRNAQEYEYKVGQNDIGRCNSIKDLGIWVDSSLKPSLHCHKVSTTANYKCISIHKNFVSKDPKFLMKLFDNYVKSNLCYCSVITNPTLKKDINTLEKVQRRFTKHINNMHNLSYEDRVKQLNIHSLEYERLKTDLIYAYKIMNGLLPTQGVAFCISNRNTRQRLTTKFKTTERQNFITNRIVNIWNQLPENIVESNSLNAFKRNLEKFDLSQFLLVNKF